MISHQRRFRSAQAFVLGLASAAAQLAWAAGTDPFFDLDLKEVLNIEITSVSKKPQTVSQAAAAVFVITADDIRRSGATTIPDLLRMVPGIQVGQISSNAWGVSARGLAGRFSNKLLVLLDGRSVYTPTFSGVYWDVQDAALADIERIEVIRGPGAALWGANAVNGVINIITKSAAATQGTLIEASTGSREPYGTAVRHGGKIGEVGHWRAYAKAFERDGSIIEQTGARGADEWRQLRAGFRTDLSISSHDTATVQGDFYRGRSGEVSNLNSLSRPYVTAQGVSQRLSGANLLGRWQRDVSETDSFTLQGYVDHTERDWPAHVDERRETIDVDLQYRSRRLSGHDLIFGAGYRHTRARFATSFTGIPTTTIPYAIFQPASVSNDLHSLFVQDDITLVPQKLVLTLGTKLEHNDHTGVEHQPNVRLMWIPQETTTVWGSVARAVRTPSALESGAIASYLIPPSLPAVPLPARVDLRSNPSSETVLTYELGWKQRVTPTWSFDLALFRSEYKHLRTTRTLSPTTCPAGGVLVPGGAGNVCLFPGLTPYINQLTALGDEGWGTSEGLEMAADWRPLSNLRFQLGWTELRTKLDEAPGTTTIGEANSAPKRQLALRAAWNPRSDLDVDLWLRHVGGLKSVGVSDVTFKPYNEADLRLAWRPRKGLELALIGRNLLHKRHKEFASEAADVPEMLVERTVLGQLTWRF